MTASRCAKWRVGERVVVAIAGGKGCVCLRRAQLLRRTRKREAPAVGRSKRVTSVDRVGSGPAFETSEVHAVTARASRRGAKTPRG
jgi:hypothetical protein